MNQRTHQLDRTRKAILEAVTEMLIGSADPKEFTMQNVADAAGVSHRTLYRHFGSRQELINAVGAEYDARLAFSRDPLALRSFETWLADVGDIMAFGAANRDVLRRGLTASVATGVWRTDRDAGYWKLFRERFPRLDEATAREDFAALRHLLWATNAVLIGERFGLEAPRVAAGIERAARALVADITERDAAAAAAEEEA